jgi:spermidine/putrescine transport system permease protein
MNAQPITHRDRVWRVIATPGIAWLVALFVVPFYAVACVAFGRIDPIFRSAAPEWNPLAWDATTAVGVLGDISNGPLRGVLLRTVVFVVVAVLISFIIGYPVAYYLARHAGRRRTLLLALVVLPFWVSYLMRMLAWVNLLQPDGFGSRALRLIGLDLVWLDGSATTVVLGLVYGYVPFFILPLYATLERIDWRLVDAARDLGASSRQAFWRVTLPLSKPGIAAGALLLALPMLGDYYTNDLLSRSPNTEMLGNQIDFFLNAGTQPQRGATLVLVLALMLAVGASWYVRSVVRQVAEATR